MIRFRRSSKSRRRASERWQQLALVGVMAGFVGALLLLGRGFASDTKPRPNAVADAQKEPQDEEIYTGSILFMPNNGKTCRQYLFDNISGRMSDNGMVDCERAAYHPASAPPKKWSAERVHVIRDAFRDR